jgi:tetratricopeptide (TPR) repeat protein
MSADSAIPSEKRARLQQLFVLGNTQMSKKGYEYANFYLSDCVLQDPGNPIYAQTFLANLKKKCGDKKKTTSSIMSVGKRATANSQKPEGVFKAGVETLQSNPWDVEALISTGKACNDLGHLKSALVYLQSAVEADPHHIGANTACCEALREAADYDGALACVQRILIQRPNDRDVRKQLQNLSVEKTIHHGKYAEGTSRDVLESAGTAIPENEDVMGRVLTPDEQIERKIAKNPQDTVNYVELAQYYISQSDFAKAEESYARAVTISNDAPAMVERLLETQEKRLYLETLRLKEEYEGNPQDDLKSVFLATRNQYKSKRMELAQYRVKQYPNHPGYRYELGVVLKKSELVKEAIAEFQFAKADKSLAGVCLLELGQCFQMIRQYKLAMTHYREAISALELGEDKKLALYLAMKLAFALEDYDQAEEYGHQLAAIDFSYRDLGDVLDQITSLEKN